VHQRTSLPPFLGQGIDLGGLEISPVPDDTQYTTSAIDLFLGDEFHVWDDQKLKFEGLHPSLISHNKRSPKQPGLSWSL
jgi:hypothetical protein